MDIVKNPTPEIWPPPAHHATSGAKVFPCNTLYRVVAFT